MVAADAATGALRWKPYQPANYLVPPSGQPSGYYWSAFGSDFAIWKRRPRSGLSAVQPVPLEAANLVTTRVLTVMGTHLAVTSCT